MSIPCEAPYCALNDGHDGEHSHVDGLVSRADRAYDERNAELEALRAQVATLTAERDEARQAHALLDGSLEVCVADWRRDLDTAQAACVAMRKALQAEEDYSQKARPSGNAELLERAVTLRRAALATDAGAPILALLDECEAALKGLPSFCRVMNDADGAAQATDLLTRLKARGPTRFVSVEKVREVAMKVANATHDLVADALGHCEDCYCARDGVSQTQLDAIVAALLAEVTP